ncbi:hypothetical protein PTKIN_Ptkin10aG0034800 [Pterospermum kingtungense]
MRIAVIGAGISGLVSAFVLAKAGVKVVLYEKEDYLGGMYLGGHAKTVNFDGVDLDLGFMVFNRVTYPNMMEFFESLGVDMEDSDMSFSVSLDEGKGCEWGSRNGLSSLFAQKKNVLNPYFWLMIREIIKFKNDVISHLEVLENNPDVDRNETLGQFIKSRGYSDFFQKAYLIPICGSIWSCPTERVMEFSAFSILSFCRNHHLLQLFGRPQWMTVRWRSHRYVNKVRDELESRGCQIRTGSEVHSVLSDAEGCTVLCGEDSQELYDGCIMAVHAPDALRLLGNQATYDESRVLGAFQYVYSDIFLHHDKNLMPQNPAAWSAWNFLGSTDKKVCLTYWLNVLQIRCQNIPCLSGEQAIQCHLLLQQKLCLSLIRFKGREEFSSVEHTKARKLLFLHFIIIIQVAFLSGYGFHEDGLKAGMVAANGVLGKSCSLLRNPKHMVPSLAETEARLFVTRFLAHFISTGCVILLEEGGTMFTFEGTSKKCSLKTVIRVHNPQFYWKVMTEADLGLADSYINGDFSFVDKNDGLLNLVRILIANRDLISSNSKLSKKRGWWTPLLSTAGLTSAKYFFKHVLRQNTLTQAPRNISRHYDLSNDLFALFLDETMTYSCAVFKTEDEDLKDAQQRKISLLIEKGNIRFQLCDYRKLPSTYNYDRIISSEMIEAVGHEYMEEFFGCCEAVLAEDGLFVLQFISIPEERYDKYRRSSDFIKEYIFPGGCLPSLTRITSAMSAASRLCVENVENIGLHYYQTLRCWRKNFLEKQSKIKALGFNDKFIRTWEYYFDYCAAGFKSNTLGNYQVVFSRPGNVAALGNPYKGFPSAS